jgi:esterase/lipase superfamily enzyme
MLSRRGLSFVGFLIITAFLGGCQPKVYLMPSPVGIIPDGKLFQLSEQWEYDNFLVTLYATNRQPIDVSNRTDRYTIFPSDTLRLGVVVDRVGEEDMTWEQMYEESLKRKRSNKLLLSREWAREFVSYKLEGDLRDNSSEAHGFFDQVNKLLNRSIDEDIIVYVHGSNSNFYRSTAQGAQFYHFTGHNSVILTFSWPSAENLLKYKTDVLHAEKTVPAFARLIELLAANTQAKNIHILAYSAGAQVVTPGLTYLVDQYPGLSKQQLKEKLRIGEVYFAAPDTAFETFIGQYLKFRDIVRRTTINLNQNDLVLRLSSMQNGVSRLGKPDGSELSELERITLITETKTPQLNVIDVSGSEALDIGGAHDSWYNHPWVSNDVLSLFLFNADPLERGLEEYWYEDGAKTYRFPSDYESRFRSIIDDHRNEWPEKLKSESKIE